MRLCPPVFVRGVCAAAGGLLLAAAGASIVNLPLSAYRAEGHLGRAERDVARYRWQRAEREFALAMAADAESAVYPGAYADFIVMQSALRDDPVPWLGRARGLYRRAAELDGTSARYPARRAEAALAEARCAIRRIERDGRIAAEMDPHGQSLVRSAFADFRRALANDPNGFVTAFAIGYGGLTYWHFLDAAEKELVIDRLRFVLACRPDHARYIYPKLWRRTRDPSAILAVTPDTVGAARALSSFVARIGAWSARKEARARIDRCLARDDPERLRHERSAEAARIAALKDHAARIVAAPFRPTAYAAIKRSGWRGVSTDGRRPLTDGALTQNGSASGVIYLPAGEATITIQARGTPAYGVYPHMIVDVDGTEIGEADVDGPAYREYRFPVTGRGDIAVLTVRYPNDRRDQETGDDRNLFLGEAAVVRDEPAAGRPPAA